MGKNYKRASSKLIVLGQLLMTYRIFIDPEVVCPLSAFRPEAGDSITCT